MSSKHQRRGAVGTCLDPRCEKQCYADRDDARYAARVLHPAEKMGEYQHHGYWHIGHDHLWRLPEKPTYDPLPLTAIRQIHQMGTACRTALTTTA